MSVPSCFKAAATFVEAPFSISLANSLTPDFDTRKWMSAKDGEPGAQRCRHRARPVLRAQFMMPDSDSETPGRGAVFRLLDHTKLPSVTRSPYGIEN